MFTHYKFRLKRVNEIYTGFKRTRNSFILEPNFILVSLQNLEVKLAE